MRYPPLEIERSYALSPMQEGMLFHSISRPRSGVDVQQLTCAPRAALDVPALLAAWDRAVARHAILRTSFRWTDLPAPRQDVHRRVALPVAHIDLRGLPPEEQAARRRAFLAEDRLRGFDLAQAPCARLTLLRVDDARTDLVWSFHHILLDGRSFLTVLREVFARYDALLAGRDLSLPEPRPFGDYIAWLEARDPGASAAFWREMLAGREGPTPLPAPRCGPPDGAEPHGRVEARVDARESAALRAVVEAHGLTLNTLLQGAWAVLLARHAGESDVVFGAVRAGRRGMGAGAETLVGMTINAVPVRARVRPGAPLLPALRAMREAWVSMREHEHAPLVRVREWAGAAGDAPLFETLLVVEAYDWLAVVRAEGGTLAGCELSLLEQTDYPLTLMADLGPAIRLTLDFDRRRIEDDAAAAVLRQLERLLAGMAEGLDREIGDLPWLTDAERRRILVGWNEPPAWPAPQATIHGLFEAQVERTPDAVAVVDGDARLTYRELDRRANRLAHRLRRSGVGPEVAVGLCAARSAGLVVAMLAILKAGGAYVPLDPAYPTQRLAQVLDDARVPLVVTEARARGRLPAGGAPAVLIDVDAEAIASERDQRPEGGAGPRNLAYVIYTSGSTGRPKGVAIEHRSTACLIAWAKEVFSPSEAEGVLFSSSICFDVSVFEVFPPLCSGGRLIVAENALALPSLPEKDEVTLFCAVPTAMAELCRAGGVPLSVHTACAGGEPLSAEVCRDIYAMGAIQRVYNVYGPTEDTTYSTFALCARDQGAPSLGRPIAHGQVYILDARMSPVPPGVTGEIYLGGEGLARGYLDRPDLTAERFLPHPFDPRGGARLYRTGDLGRFRPDGEIEFFGRTDHQVKVRGLRVELGELESVLRGHPDVQEAVVVARDDAPRLSGKRLVAYVVPKQEPRLRRMGGGELRTFVRERLPEFMVPSAYVILEALPRTPSGKVARASLPAPEPEPGAAGAPYTPPRTPVEALLAEIWSDELGVATVGVHDNYFDLGGHSLVSLRIIDRAAHAGLEITAAQVFQHQTIADLAAVITTTPAAVAGGVDGWPLVAMRPRGARPPLFFVHTAPGDVFGYTSLVRALGPDQPCYGFQSTALRDLASAHRTIDEMAACYVELMREVSPRGPYHLAGWCFGGLVAYAMACRLADAGDEVGLCALIDATAPPPGVGAPGYYVDLARAALAMSPRDVARYLRAKVDLAATRREEARDAAGSTRSTRGPTRELNIRAFARWRPRPYPGRVTVLRCSAGISGMIDDPALRWARLAAAVDVHVVPGTHTSMLHEPSARLLAAALVRAMHDGARALAPSSTAQARAPVLSPE